MVKIRLTRRGKKHYPTYRIVVADSKSPRDGKHLDDLGYYQPMENPMAISIDMEKLEKWLANGAQPTERVAQLIKYAKNPSALKTLEKKRAKFKKKKIHKHKKVEEEQEKEEVKNEPEKTEEQKEE